MTHSVKVGRVALVVTDVDAAARDFTALFGMSFELFDIPSFQMRVAVGEHGLELTQYRGSEQAPSAGTLLSGVCIAVADVEKTRAHLLANGQEQVMSIPLQSGRSEYVFKPIHGIPVMIYQECGHFDLMAQ